MSLMETLELLAEKPRNISELSELMGLERESVQDRLNQLVRMGFLVKEESDAPSNGKKCRGCGCCSNSGCSIPLTSYRISEKGVRALG